MFLKFPIIKNFFNFICKYRIIVILFLLVLVLVILKIVTNQNLINSQRGYIIDINGNKKISFKELIMMDDKTRNDYYINLTQEERKQIPDDYFEGL